MLRIDLQCWQ